MVTIISQYLPMLRRLFDHYRLLDTGGDPDTRYSVNLSEFGQLLVDSELLGSSGDANSDLSIGVCARHTHI